MRYSPFVRSFFSLTPILGALVILAAGCKKGSEGAWDMPTQAVVAKAVRQPVMESISLVGSFEASDKAELVSELEAHVKEILFKEGQHVTKGQALILLDATRPSAQLAAAEAEATLRSSDLERGNTLKESGTIAAQEFDRLHAAAQAAQANLALAKQDMADTTITAPFDGFVADVDLSVGSFVHRGQTLSTVVATDPLKVNFNVPERYASELKEGQSINITAAASTNICIGEVYFVSPRVDEDARTILMKAHVSNADGSLKPGMFGRLDLVLRTRENAITIPEAAVKYGNNAAMVVVGTPNPTNASLIVAEFRPIEIGTHMRDQVEVISGLKEGELVVVEGHQKMGPGSKIKISPKSEKYGVTPPPESAPAAAPAPKA